MPLSFAALNRARKKYAEEKHPEEKHSGRKQTARLALAASLLTAGVLALVSGTYAVPSQAGPEPQSGLSRAMPVLSTRVTMENGYEARRLFTGRAIAGQVSVLSFELGGLLETVTVDIGTEVKKGQRLAQLDTARLQARRRETEASLAEAKANLQLASRTLKRTQDTFDKGHASAQRLDETEARAVALTAQVDRLQAALETLDLDIEKSSLKAPYDGTITRRLMDEGSVIGAGIQLLEISETSKLEAHIGMPPKYANALREGAAFTLYGQDRMPLKDAEIRSIVPVVTGQTRTMRVTFNLSAGSAARGELISASVTDWQEQTGAWLPLRALSADVRGLWRVYKVVEGANGPHVRFENVQILYTDGNKVFVTGTLTDGDQLISEGLSRLASGQRVMLTNPQTSAPPLPDQSR